MHEPRHIADSVSRWTGLGVKLPKDLAKAVEVFEALTYTEVGYHPVFDPADVTAANAESKIREYAEALALAEATDGGLSALGRAKREAVNAAARQVTSLARQAVPAVIEQLTSEFNKHAEVYIEAVSKLPNDLTAETLVAAGADAVSAYGQAQQAAQYLYRISSWVAGTGPLGFGSETYPAVRILRPATHMELVKLEEAHQLRGKSPTLAAIHPVLYTAARMGIEFGINTLAECADITKRLGTLDRQAAAAAFPLSR